MRKIDRFLFKLVILHLVILITVQILFPHVSWFSHVNKLIDYEGVAGMETQDKLEVIQQHKGN